MRKHGVAMGHLFICIIRDVFLVAECMMAEVVLSSGGEEDRYPLLNICFYLRLFTALIFMCDAVACRTRRGN